MATTAAPATDTSAPIRAPGDEIISADRSEVWRLIAPIGAGSSAEVWLARQTAGAPAGAENRKCAVKIFVGATREEQREDMARIAREAAVYDRLEEHGWSPFIARAYGSGRDDDGRVAIAYEYAGGGSLGDAIHGGDRFDARKAAWVCQMVSRGMADAGIVHRDLKPDNILLDSHGAIMAAVLPGDHRRGIRAMVADLGCISNVGLPHPMPRITGQGQTLGTPIYMSPEAWIGGDADARDDIYALGVTLICTLTAGNGPTEYDGAHTLEDLTQAAYKGLACAEITDPAFRRVVQKMVALRREDRYQSWSEVERALSAISGAEIAA